MAQGLNGRPGNSIPAAQASQKLFLGGGGGMGHGNDGNEYAAGDGGGIILFTAAELMSNGYNIRSNGSTALTCSGIGDCTDGMSGGGAGGTVLFDVPLIVAPAIIEAAGGSGANSAYINAINPGQQTGPGGGGGGGYILTSQPVFSPLITAQLNGGINGVSINQGDDAYEAQPGESGQQLLNVQLYKDETLFRNPLDSVHIDSSFITCRNYQFNGLAFTNGGAVVNQWLWETSDGQSYTTQVPDIIFGAGGMYEVRLTGTTTEGCIARDTILVNIPPDPQITLTPDTLICTGSTIQLQVSGGNSYQWSPAGTLSDPNSDSPIASPSSVTEYFVQVTDQYGCTYMDSVTIGFRAEGQFGIRGPSSVCAGDTVHLFATGGSSYAWTPAGSLNNANIANPVASPAGTTVYEVNVSESVCGRSAVLSTTVTVQPLPVVNAAKSNDLDCSTGSARLTATGSPASYVWSPAATLSTATGSSTVASPRVTTQYVVSATSNGCSGSDTLLVQVTNANEGGYLMPGIFTPNNDGVNECFGVGSWGVIDHLEFSIYNRWGQRIFYTTNPADCWDGRFKGVPQPLGVYVYMIRASTNCSPEVFRKGTFTLAR